MAETNDVQWPETYTPPAENELDQLGFSQTRLCPVCKAHLYWSTVWRPHFICLNACHLGKDGQAWFNALWRGGQ